VVAILTPIYEAEFLGFSYGFRPKRSQHQALDALASPLRFAQKITSNTTSRPRAVARCSRATGTCAKSANCIIRRH
jgi:hypothetical protein